MIPQALIDACWPRFVAKISAPCPFSCWHWTGARSRGKGNRAWYGTFTVSKIRGARAIVVRALTFMCEAAGIEVPPGWHRDHLCGDALCVNPLHVEAVTPRENSLWRWFGRRKAI